MGQERSVHETVATLGAAARREVTAIARHVRGLDDAGWDSSSWCEGWSVREVVAHLAEGVDRFTQQVRGALAGQPIEFAMAERDARRQVVKALPPAELINELKRRTGGFYEYLESLTPEQLTTPRVPMAAGLTAPLAIAYLRLQEPAIHRWDILAPTQPDATLDPDSAALLIDYVLGNASRQTRPEALAGLDATYHLQVEGPGGGRVIITCREGKATVARAADSGPVALTLSTEALVRLLWGRMAIERALERGVLRGDPEAARALGRVFGNR
ncbi:MAG TPA: maleylpyruvate isomerase family mycothiol-dependent enzyme [Chloroflexota bacterium]|nr:maleylpyruvate isomerase family mycothiol-dependent enzyme [Chloroflexota bacterium]